ncbi:MAG: Lrp/AsnC family transcriptional regulator [Gammaproteobacteria bacterium]|nr:Lrp/AsnC family transcriptional regulator [Gammaproteobacteria bacterium]
MITAVALIKCQVGTAHDVAQALVDVEGVAEVYSISGSYDILAMIRVRDYDDLAPVVSERIAAVPGVKHTKTHMAFRCYSKHKMEQMWAAYIGTE